MATNAVQVRKPTAGAVTSWQDKLAARAKKGVEQAQSIASGQFIGTRAGQLTWQGAPVANNKMNVVILDWIFENAYYPGRFDPDNPQPPVCFAFGREFKEMAPHDESLEKQNDTCKGCQWNEFKSAEQGSGKACKNIVRLGLVSATPLTVDGIRKGEVAFLKVPVTSVKGWAAYLRSLELLYKRPPEAVITEVSSVPHPKNQFQILFNYVADVDEKLLEAITTRADAVAAEIDFPYAPPNPEPPAPAPARGQAQSGGSVRSPRPAARPAGKKY